MEISSQKHFRRSGVNLSKNDGRHETMSWHGMRKRFVTILKNEVGIQNAVVERLVGHKIYQEDGMQIDLDDSYFRPTLDELFDKYKLAIHALTVDDMTRIQIKEIQIQKQYSVLEEERNEIFPNGKNKLLNKLSWTLSYLKQANLIFSPRRGIFVITDQGHSVLNQKLEKIDRKFLKQFQSPEELSDPVQTHSTSPKTPDEQIEDGICEIQKSLETELLQLIKSKKPEFFERLVLEICEKILKGKGIVTGRTGDGGIDGIVSTDELGLEQVLLQAKKWEANVSEPDIRNFAGSILGKHGKKGIFITTSDFASTARIYVKELETKIILINGRELVSHMIKYDVGVKSFVKHEIKKIDTDYFAEEE